MKELEIVIFGATGYTGSLVAAYLAAYEGSLSWAIAGRSKEKLEALRAQLVSQYPAAAPELIVADSFDKASLQSLARRTKVVCSTVGPYVQYGALLVEVCVAEGADYCDLTGETPFISKMIKAHHEQAEKEQRKIVHSCGFDSIPSDLGCWMLQKESIERYGAPLDEIKFFLGRTKGGLSGGTLASMMGLFERAGERKKAQRSEGSGSEHRGARA